VRLHKHGRPGMFNPCPGQCVNAGLVGQNGIAKRQTLAILVPEQIPISGQADNGNGSGPQAVRNARVVQPQRDQVRPPSGRELGRHIVPTRLQTDSEIDAASAERQASTRAADFTQIGVGEVGGRRSEQKAWDHGR
jgi:hypothetical protein